MDLKELYQIVGRELPPLSPLDFRPVQVKRPDQLGTQKVVVSYLVEDKNKTRTITSSLMDLPYERVYKSLRINKDRQVEELLMPDNDMSF